jgi:hypothetical protein
VLPLWHCHASGTASPVLLVRRRTADARHLRMSDPFPMALASRAPMWMLLQVQSTAAEQPEAPVPVIPYGLGGGSPTAASYSRWRLLTSSRRRRVPSGRRMARIMPVSARISATVIFLSRPAARRRVSSSVRRPGATKVRKTALGRRSAAQCGRRADHPRS